jgi:hypothetical protein
MSVSHRIRGILKTTVFWGIAWALNGAVLAIGLWLMIGRPMPTRELWRLVSYQIGLWTVWGALSGAVFAILTLGAERSRTLRELSTARIALWGALAGIALPLVTYALVSPFLLGGLPLSSLLGAAAVTLASGAMGAAIAATNLSLARRLAVGQPTPPRIEQPTP